MNSQVLPLVCGKEDSRGSCLQSGVVRWTLELKNQDRDFPGSPVVKTLLLLQGAQVQSLVRELDPNCHN